MPKSEDNLKPQPYLLYNTVQRYTWGSRGADAFIPRLLGQKVQPDVPYAELWMGAHPKAPSRVLINNDLIPFSELVKKYPRQILGDRVAAKFGTLPFLFKVLSAGEALSIQAHPNKTQAEKLHAKDPVNYPDDNHKPEIAIALDQLTALVGFKKKSELTQVLQRHNEIAEFLGKGTVANFYTEGDESEAIRLLYEGYLTKAVNDPDRFKQAVKSLKTRLIEQPNVGEAEALFTQMADKYGSRDVGLFSIFFLKLLHLKASEAVFLQAGIPHAYVKGNIVECMANSDNVVRAGLTPKYQDVNALLQILDYSGERLLFPAQDNKVSLEYPAPVSEFCLFRHRPGPAANIKLNFDSIVFLLVVEGEVTLRWAGGDEKVVIHKGQAFFLPAALGSVSIQADKPSVLFQVKVP